jgi:hypothetical protein
MPTSQPQTPAPKEARERPTPRPNPKKPVITDYASL